MNRTPQSLVASRPRHVAARRGQLAIGGYWPQAGLAAALMMLVIAIRLHEFVPRLQILQPAILAMGGGFALVFARSAQQVRTAALTHPLTKLVLLYVGFMILSIPFALWPSQSVGSVKGYVPAAALLLTILACRPDERTRRQLQIFFVAGCAVYAIYAKLLGRADSDGRLAAGQGMYDSNDMAAMLAIGFPLALGLVVNLRGARRVAAAGAALLLLVVIVASGSRGGGLALGAGALVYAASFRGHRLVLATTALLAGTLLLWNLSPSFRTRMSTLTNLDNDYNTTEEVGRKQVWKRGRAYIRENPVLGVGVGNFPIAEGEFFGAKYQGTRGAKWSNAHNAYIQAYAELGLLGGSVFVGMLVCGARYAWPHWAGRRRRGLASYEHRPELLAGLCSYAVSATFLSHAYFNPLMALLGLIGLYRSAHIGTTAARAPAIANRRTLRRGDPLGTRPLSRPAS